MATQQTASITLTPGQALYVLDRLVRERRVNGRDVERMAAEMDQEIRELERRLSLLRNDGGAGRGGRGRSGGAGRSAGKRSSAAVNPAVAASRRLQGEYMGLLRHIKGRERARIKKIAAEKGREAAVKEMRSSLDR